MSEENKTLVSKISRLIRRGGAAAEVLGLLNSLSNLLVELKSEQIISLTRNTSLLAEIPNLLSHESEDIVEGTLSLLEDMTDPQLFSNPQNRAASLKFVDGLLDSDSCKLVTLLIESKPQLSPTCLQILDNLCEVYPSAAPQQLAEQAQVVERLVQLVTLKIEDPREGCQVQLQASDLLAVVVHASQVARTKCIQFLEDLLKTMSRWKKHGPLSEDEEEWCENLHGVTRRCLLNNRLVCENEFAQSLEGIELALKLKAEKLSVTRLKLLKVVLAGSTKNCSRLVTLKGVEELITATRKLEHQSKLRRTEHQVSQQVRELFGVLAEICLVELHTEPRVWESFLAQLTNAGGVDLTLSTYRKLATDRERLVGNAQDSEDEEYQERLEAGLYDLQRLCVVIMRLVHNGEQIRAQLQNQLEVEHLCSVLIDFAENVVVIDALGNLQQEESLELKSRVLKLATKT